MTDATAIAIPTMLDVRDLAKRLSMEPIELVRELQTDNVSLLPISAKRWRVAEPDFVAWLDLRKKRGADLAAQQSRRAAHIAGKPTVAPSKRKVQFRR